MTQEEDQARRAAASLMGKKGGPARAEALTKKERQEIARKAAAARWGRKRKTREA